MRLYREVPPEQSPGLYLYKHVHDFVDAKYVHALESIEITEEDDLLYPNPISKEQQWKNIGYIRGKKAILSKLNETKNK